MGSRLVGEALEELATLDGKHASPAARLVLLLMCHRAHDQHRPPRYFGGRDSLAAALGYGHLAECNRTRCDSCDPAGKRATDRAMKQLVTAGLVEQEPGHPLNHNRRWVLLPHRLNRARPVDNGP